MKGCLFTTDLGGGTSRSYISQTVLVKLEDTDLQATYSVFVAAVDFVETTSGYVTTSGAKYILFFFANMLVIAAAVCVLLWNPRRPPC